MMAFCTALLIGISVCLGTPGSDTPVFTVEDVNPVWLSATRKQVVEQLEMLTSAYALDQATRQVLIDELQRRLEAEVGYQRSTNVELEALNEKAQAPGAGEEAMDALMAKLQEVIENAPLNEDHVAEWLEGHLDPALLPDSRRRLKELRFRRQRKRDVRQEDALQRSKTRKTLARNARRCEARLTEQGHPLPTRLEIEEAPQLSDGGRIVRPGQGAARRNHDRARLVDSTATSPITLKCAPLSLHDWDRFLRGALAGANADAAQAEACRALLARFKEKASQYVQDRAEVFGTLALAPTPEAYEARLAELRQGTPIDAYFAELKLRVADVLNR